MLKYFINKRKKGQSTLEYAILIIIIIGALLSIQVYIKRGVQGRFKSAADDIGDQWSPGYTNLTRRTVVISNTYDTFIKGETSSELTADEITTISENIIVGNEVLEFWG